MVRSRSRRLGVLLVVLAVGLAVNAVLGPLVLGVIEYRYGPSMTSQGVGLDAVALLAVAPVALLAAALVHRERAVGPVLAFVPGTFAAYMAPQYVVGPDYLGLPGNNERFLLLHLLLLVVGIAVVVLAWLHVDRARLVPATPATDRRRTWVLLGVAGFVLLRWLPLLPALLAGAPTVPAFVDNPTAFMLIAVLDLGVVVPATLTAAAGLRAGAPWGRVATYAVVGFFAIVPLSVAAMAVAMRLRGDPLASAAEAVGFSVVAVATLAGAWWLYRPVWRAPDVTVPEARARDATGSPGGTGTTGTRPRLRSSS